jgi:hypothetical protein
MPGHGGKLYQKTLIVTVRAAPWMAGSSPAMTVKGLIKTTVMPGLDPGIHVRESMSKSSRIIG